MKITLQIFTYPQCMINFASYSTIYNDVIKTASLNTLLIKKHS